MLKVEKKRSVLALILGSAIALSAGVCSVVYHNVKASAHTFQQTGTLATDLKRGEKITVPDGKFGDVQAEHYVYCPNGDVYSSDELTLETHGVYTIKYTATVDGKMLTEEKTFEVANPVTYFTGTGNGSYTEYGYREDTKRSGLTVRIAEGDTFYYNNPIDLKNSSFENPAFAFTWAPAKLGFDMSMMYIRLTDVYDSEKFVEVRMNLLGATNGYHWPVAHARYEGQLWKAWDYSKGGQLQVNNSYGLGFSSYGEDTFRDRQNQMLHENVLSTQKIWFWYDHFENKIYLCYIDLNRPEYVQVNNGQTLPGFNLMLIDFDDASYQETLFPGFETGEVFLSIECENYRTDTAGIQLLSVKGQDLSVDKVQSTTPKIDVDTGNYDVNALPHGNVGYTYPVFPAVASDIYSGGSLPVETRVFYNYTKSAGAHYDDLGRYVEEIPVVNGRFATPYEGYYAISYRTKNYSNDSSEYVVGVQVDAASSVVALDNIVLENGYKTTAVEYETVDLANVASFGGGKGNLTLTRSVAVNNKAVAVKGNDVLGYSFMPTEQGTYKVAYRVEDLIGNVKESSYNVVVSNRTMPVFLEDAKLPKLFFTNEEYVLPALKALDLTQQAEIAADVTIVDGAGERAYVSGKAETFTPNADGVAVIKYTANGEKVEYNVPVVVGRDESKNVQIANYFSADESLDFAVETGGAVAKTTEGGEFEFLNAVVAKDLSMELIATGLGTKFDKFVITLTDAYDELCAVKLGVVKTADGLGLVANNGDSTRRYKNTLTDALKVALKYDTVNNRFYVDSEFYIEFNKTCYAEPFTGFPSNKVYVSFALEDVHEESSVTLTKMNNQNITNTIKRDNSTPILYLNGGYTSTVCALNQNITVYSGYAGDILSPNTSLTVSLTFNGKPVVSKEGVTLKDAPVLDTQYTFEVSEFGEYILTYTALDWNNKKFQRAYRFTARDAVAPELTLDGEIPTDIQIGYVTLPTAKATDNISAEKKIKVFAVVFDPKDNVLYVKNNQFIAQYKGEYTVKYYAIDEAGNETTLVYKYTIA